MSGSLYHYNFVEPLCLILFFRIENFDIHSTSTDMFDYVKFPESVFWFLVTLIKKNFRVILS